MKANVIQIDKVEGVEVDEVAGLCLTKDKRVSWEAARKEREDAIRKGMEENGLPKGYGSSPFLTIQLLCGEKVIYQTLRDIPNESVPCPCGNPKHWMVKIVEAE